MCWYFSRPFDVLRKNFICMSFKKFKLRQLLAQVSPHDGALLEGVENVNECCVSPASHISRLFAIQSRSLACLCSHRLGRCSLLLNWIWTQINLMFSLAKLDLSFSSRWTEVFESSKGARDIRGQRESEPNLKTGQLLLSLDVLIATLVIFSLWIKYKNHILGLLEHNLLRLCLPLSS